MRFFIPYIILSFLCVPSISAQAQHFAAQPVEGQPSPEVYDLLKDSKGYLWLAHDKGISRYDGMQFLNFFDPQQNSLSMTDLAEDRQGRIWCHNFTGQIFYIEQLQLNLLASYNYNDEKNFPRLVVCEDEVVATSNKGLFVHHTQTGQSRYYNLPGGTGSLTAVGNTVIAFGAGHWYRYEAGKGVTVLKGAIELDKGQTYSLQNVSRKDTFFLTANPSGTYFLLTLEKDSIKVHAQKKTASFINTISIDGSNTWIHTKDHSFTTNGKHQLSGYNLTDVISSSNGHRWMSSLKSGLNVLYNADLITNYKLAGEGSRDEIKRIANHNNKIYAGSARGVLYEQAGNGSFVKLDSIPLQAGGIEKLVSLDSSHLLIAAAVGLYIYNSSTRQVGKLSTYLIAKEVRLRDGVVYLATTTGVASFRLGQPGRQSWHINEKLFGKSNRCRSITFAGDTLYAAYSDGVYLVHNGKMEKLLYKDAPVFASNLHTYSSRILISTYNQGLLILQKKKISTLTDKNGLASNFIQDITETGGAAWLVYEDHVQQLGSSLPVMESKAITFAPVSDIEDFEVFRNRLYIVAGGVVYSMNQTQPATKSNISTAIDKLMVNEKTVFGVSRLPHSQNNLQFHVSTPFFSPFAKILYQYRIKSQTDSTWQTATPGQTTFTILALPPGSYTFEVVAIDNSREVISKPAFYRFQILPPWYQTWYFRTALVLLLLGLSFAALRFYFKNRLRKQRQEYEKILAVQGERQRIAAEIHDDIGAGLSAVRLLTEMVQHKVEKSEIHKDVNQIQTYLSDLSLKIKEVIWSLNASNDRLENLLFYIQRQALALFENSGIELKISLPPHPIENIAIQGEKRRHIYLAVKEALHNCLKHAQARHCWLQMKLEAEVLLITVADDGIGFDHVKNNGAGNGIFNMHKRMEQVDGSFRISTTEATEVHFSIPLNEDE